MKLPSRQAYSIIGLHSMISYLGQDFNLKKLRLVEIGSWIGTSACIFAKYFKEVICIDPFLNVKGTITEDYDMQSVYQEFKKNISRYKNITHILHPSYSILPTFSKNEIDITYIDGSHIYEDVKQDIEMSTDKTKYYITGHDYWPGRFDGVVQAVNEIFGKPDKVFSDTSWIKRL